MTIRIRPTEDYRVPLALDKEIFPDDGPPDTDGFWFLGVDTDNKEPVCYASYRLYDDGVAYLTRAGVGQHYRGKGLQKRLIKIRLRHAKKQGAKQALTYVEKSNVASLNSLIAVGFSFYRPQKPWAGTNFLYLRKAL